MMQAVENTGAAISFLCIAASLLHLQGQLHAAWRTYQEAIALGKGPMNVPFAAVGLAYAYQALVRIYLSQGELETVQATLVEMRHLPLLVQNPSQQSDLT